MNRKYVLKNRRRFYTFIIFLFVAFSSILIACNVNGEDVKPKFEEVTVEKGDTLWKLAKKYSKGGDIRKYIRKIEEANNITDSTIYEGDIIKLPM